VAETSEETQNPQGTRRYSVEKFGPRINAFLDMICRRSSLELRYEVREGRATHPEIENPELVVRFTGNDVDVLLANRAELLLALEQLTLELLRMPSEHHSLLCFDANDYRMMRMEELHMTALAAAERVKKTRMPFFFSPMTSRERRIIHLALRDETSLRSESVGTGPARQVVVLPKDMPLPPQPPPPRHMGDEPRSRSGGPARGGRPGTGRRGNRR
jgi:spoIIIJ-associated protein